LSCNSTIKHPIQICNSFANPNQPFHNQLTNISITTKPSFVVSCKTEIIKFKSTQSSSH
jgi:hypothetical protein